MAREDNTMPTCVPIKELKNTATFAKLVEESDGPIIVTKNGYESFAVMTMDQLEALELEAKRAQLYQAIDQAEQDMAAGRVSDGWESMRSARDRYGL